MLVRRYKWFWAWSFEKEEAWLNQMAAQGLHLASVGFCRYDFEEGNPGDYTIRLELLKDLPARAESRRYIQFIEDTGAEQVGSLHRWAYFRRKRGSGAFDLFSDIDSRIQHLKRILYLMLPAGLLALYNTGIMLRFYYSEPAVIFIGMATVFGLFSLLILCGFMRIYRKKRKLQQERALHE